ncbi:hypothetical protein [Devosia alba]|uniref:hypothetical protein n=1 Tax=Devosia alba TaxID=3152360 RepID=UPI003266BC53
MLSCLEIDLMNTTILSTGNKGGVGKTTTAQGIIEYLMAGEVPVHIAQIDRQARLAQLNNCEVLTIASDPDAARVEPALEMARFGPLMDLLDATVGKGTTVIDLGANEVDRFSAWARLCELDEELVGAGRTTLIFNVFNAEEQSIIEAAKSAEMMSSALPSAQIVYVENQRFSRVKDLNPGSAALSTYQRLIEPALKTAPSICIPRISGNSYQWFEQQRISFGRVALMDTHEIMAVTGLGKADAKIARGDIAHWMGNVFGQLDTILGHGVRADDRI